ncbi:nucleotidyltransferase [Bacillus wiedmannii]|uniref:nucleotidyltransferase domain-containing protein n=1 Tax=Bacillus wiedmannii TaxID=1890302 RepID=UPI000BF107CF|nr:nucleotidyltransferase domain-containing protein [Bacillus wiedmannii]PEM99655.1 nucleotidyltransferase [Bacillus wiedmannii]
MKPMEAAQRIITSQFPNCDVALLGGSVVRGEATKTSDLDIVIVDQNLPSCYRESFYSNGWPVEVFVHNFETCKTFFKMDCDRGRPSLPQLVSEGIVLKGENEIVEKLKREAKLHEYILRVNGKWLGSSKWFIRVLRKYDEQYADQFVEAFDHFYTTGEKRNLITFVEKTLEQYGGRKFEGFSIGK